MKEKTLSEKIQFSKGSEWRDWIHAYEVKQAVKRLKEKIESIWKTENLEHTKEIILEDIDKIFGDKLI